MNLVVNLSTTKFPLSLIREKTSKTFRISHLHDICILLVFYMYNGNQLIMIYVINPQILQIQWKNDIHVNH